MYSNLPADVRTHHPFHMYDEIREQAEAIARSLTLALDAGDAVHTLARARRVFVTGCGTSFHAAQGGAWFLRSFSRGKIEAQAIGAYELVTYLPGIRPDDVVVAVTHSGGTTMTLRAIERAHQCGAETVVVTGFPDGRAAKVARYVVLTGYEAERSWAHTISYTTALATLASLANALAHPEERLDLSPLPAVVGEVLGLEGMARRIAGSLILTERYRTGTQIVLVGAGPNAPTAHEGALKLLETSYVRASAVELEQMLHGPLAAVSEETLVMILAPTGASIERARELARAVYTLETTPIVLTGEGHAQSFEHANVLTLPDIPEILSPIPYVVPLQLFSYFLAVGMDMNPDLIHRDDERYRTARAQYT